MSITDSTWNAIGECRILKANKNRHTRKEYNKAYSAAHKEQSLCRPDNEIWFDDKVTEMETTAGHSDSKTLCQIVKEIS